VKQKQQGIVLDHLTPTQSERLRVVVHKYPDVLTPKLGLTHLIQYDIQLKDKTPVRSSPYRLAPPKMDILRQQIDKLLREGVIEPSQSPYSSPMFLVPKRNNSQRAVVDFRALIKKIEIESVPLPDIHSSFHWFTKAKYFTTLDLNLG
jgi:hypothetical protein